MDVTDEITFTTGGKVVVYKLEQGGPDHIYTCSSGRYLFDLVSAAHRARNLVRAGAYEARVIGPGAEVAGHWQRNSVGEVVQLAGPDL